MSGSELLIATAISAASTISQSARQSASVDFSAEINAQEAARERQLAALDVRDVRRRNSALQAQQRALLAGSGIDPAQGTALLVQEAAAGEAELDAVLARAAGEDRARRREVQSELARNRSGDTRSRGLISLGTTLLDGAEDGGLFS